MASSVAIELYVVSVIGAKAQAFGEGWRGVWDDFRN